MPLRNLHFLSIESEFGAGSQGSSLGPDAVKFAAYNRHSDIFLRYPGSEITRIAGKLAKGGGHDSRWAAHLEDIRDTYAEIIEQVSGLLAQRLFPFVLSGDHSNAGGVIAGLKKHYPDKRLGVVWIDAHADLHSPFTTPSGNVHGMPLATALNLTADQLRDSDVPIHDLDADTRDLWEDICTLVSDEPGITFSDLVFIGIRDYEAAEAFLIQRFGTRYYTPGDVSRLGAAHIARQTLAHLAPCDLIYVSFDIDSLDANCVPGTGTPVEQGLSTVQAFALLQQLWQSDKLACMEFTEINPLLDHRNQTAEIAFDLLQNLVAV